jgi:flagellar basal-body rod modification protein FlgD
VREASVIVRDASGALVARLPVSPTAGSHSFSWSGARLDGTAAAPGAYQMESIANVGGRNQSMEVMLRSRVNSVTLDANGRGLTLNTPNGSLLLSDVRQVM